MKKTLAVIVSFILLVTLFTGCGGESKPAASGKVKEGFVIGVSNGYIGNGWRTQMIDSIEILGQYYKGQGLVKEVIIQNAGVDVNNQIAQIRNLINAEVDLLMIDPNSETALNPVIEEAHSKGIPVICFDQPVTSEYAMNVVIDQVTWGVNSAQWLVDELGGKGDIVIVSGLPGHPANVNRLKGMQQVLDKNPGINVLTEVNGNWDQASAQQAMSSLIASYPNIDGVLTQDGMALGVINAYEALGKELPVVTGETMMGFIKKWDVLKADGFGTYAQNNPPGIGATALGIAVRLLQGKEMKELNNNTYIYPVKEHITNANFGEYFEKYKDKPDSYFIDEWLTESELDALFK